MRLVSSAEVRLDVQLIILLVVRGLGRIRPTCTEFLLQNDLGVSYEKIIVTPLMQLWTFSRIIPSDPFKRWVENFEPEHDCRLSIQIWSRH